MPKILVIDDKQDNLITLSAILKNLIPECHVLTAQSGPEGLEKAKSHSPDTILLDIKMPGMDGVEMVLMDMDPQNPIYEELKEIQDAARGSADLTRQLLAFARKQTIAPREPDLNETVEGMLKMLRRLIGEDIDLSWQPETNLWPVKMDPVQIDQILANLAVNARDAIAGVGKVTIETQSVILEEAYCAEPAGFIPGEFAMLAVSDNGCGMDKTTLNQIFEPFFSTEGDWKRNRSRARYDLWYRQTKRRLRHRLQRTRKRGHF